MLIKSWLKLDTQTNTHTHTLRLCCWNTIDFPIHSLTVIGQICNSQEIAISYDYKLMERLFPSSENTGCTPSCADVPDICDCCLEPKHDTLRLSALLLAKNFDWSCQLLRIFYFLKRNKNTFTSHWQHVKSHRLQLFLLLFFFFLIYK